MFPKASFVKNPATIMATLALSIPNNNPIPHTICPV